METGLTASDVALLNGNRGDNYGWGSDGGAFMWIFALLILAGGGFGGFGNGFNNAIGYENLATSNEVQRGFDNQNAMANQREILSAVTSGTAQGIAATNQAQYESMNMARDIQSQLQERLADLHVSQQNILANQNECCCNTLRAIDGVNYNNALNTASINANTTEQTQKILDAIQQNKIDDLQNQVNSLNLANQMAGVLRYPMSATYSTPMPWWGNNGCGCNSSLV